MTTLSRRMMMMAGAAMAGGAAGTRHWQGSEQPPFGPSPAPLSGNELPSFSFAMSTVEPKPFDGGWAKEATVKEFPVSEKLAGVEMQFAPGALRELHWHANAAEWGYVIEGQCRITTIDPQNRAEIARHDRWRCLVLPARPRPLDRSHRHERLPLPARLRQWYFSEFGTFSVSDWLAHTPVEVLARNFGVPPETFAGFPTKEVYIAKGPVPAPLPADPPPGSLNEGPLTHRYRFLAAEPQVFEGGTLRLVSEVEFPISTTMTGALLAIKPGGMRELHWHPHAARNGNTASKAPAA